MAVYKATALVLRRIPLGETDKIVTILTREGGKYNAVAKGARRPTSRLAGASEPLMLLRALLAEGRSLDILTQCEIKEAFPLLRNDWGRFVRATYACELMDRVTVERDPAPEAFDLLLSTLYVLQRAVQPDAALHAYELQLLMWIGYEPRLDVCVRCDRAFTATDPVASFSAQLGGVLCVECVDRVRDDLLECSPETLEWLVRLAAADDARALAVWELPQDALTQTNRILRAHLRVRIEREIKSTAMLDGLRLDEAPGASPTTGPTA